LLGSIKVGEVHLILGATSHLAEAVTLLTCVQKMTASNFDWDTGYPDRVFVMYLNPCSQMSS
jgi:hypothetical protein